jgi:hypothetical protein
MSLTLSVADASPASITPADSQAMTETDLSSAMDTWKSALLNDTEANPLLRLPEEGTVDVGAPGTLTDVCNLLVLRAKPVSLWDPRTSPLQKTVMQQPGNYTASPAVLERLRYLAVRTENLIQSRDVNVLYLAVGVLAWKDANSGATFRSPLLLVPVMLERGGGGANYVISRVEQSVEVNPLLRQRLAHITEGIVLPPLPEEAYLVVSAYLAQVAALVGERDGWGVESRCLLGHFPLPRIRLHEDVSEHETHVRSHPFVRALAGNVDALEELAVPPTPVTDPASENSSSQPSPSHFQLLDADPDQERAIQAAVQGRSFVLQGPPGTGKTQTITNIIGECIALGKSVLLVSGRVSSLEAVHQRMTDRGLGDLCLTAHSLNTSKRDILQQLSRSLRPEATTSPGAIADTAAKLSGNEYQELETLREDLEAVVRELHRVRQPLGVSLYEAYGIIAEAEGDEPLRTEWARHLANSWEGVERTSRSEHRRLLDRVSRLSSHPLWPHIPESALWHGAFGRSVTAPAWADLQQHFADTLAVLYRLQYAADTLSRRCGLKPPRRMEDVERLLRFVRAFLDAPPHCLWLLEQSQDDTPVSERLARYREQAARLCAQVANLRSAQDRLLERYSAAILGLSPEEND